jgi:hypothetical protein
MGQHSHSESLFYYWKHRNWLRRKGSAIGIKTAEATDTLFLEGKIGWGGRIRTFTVLINSEVSYQLDHAPAERSVCSGRTGAIELRRCRSGDIETRITRGPLSARLESGQV